MINSKSAKKYAKPKYIVSLYNKLTVDIFISTSSNLDAYRNVICIMNKHNTLSTYLIQYTILVSINKTLMCPKQINLYKIFIKICVCKNIWMPTKASFVKRKREIESEQMNWWSSSLHYIRFLQCFEYSQYTITNFCLINVLWRYNLKIWSKVMAPRQISIKDVVLIKWCYFPSFLNLKDVFH